MSEQQQAAAQTEQAAQAVAAPVAPAEVPAMPEAPPLVPSPPAEPPAPKDRRVLRAVLRWTAAVVVFAAVGAGTAYGIAGMERTDVPGLATESDGRWEFPTLTKPPLPSGSPGPFAEANLAGAHYADLRALVLPAPRGAEQDKALRGADGWLPTEDFLAEFTVKEEREEFRQQLVDHGLRHIAARGWTTQDGTHTRVYLLHFGTAAVADSMLGNLAPYSGPAYAVRGAEVSAYDEAFGKVPMSGETRRTAYVEVEPYAAEQVRQAYVTAGDVLAVVIQSRKGDANPVPFQQTVMLQSQLLG